MREEPALNAWKRRPIGKVELLGKGDVEIEIEIEIDYSSGI